MTPEVEKVVVNIMKLKAQEYNLISISSGGSQPLTFTQIAVVRKESLAVTSRCFRVHTLKD